MRDEAGKLLAYPEASVVDVDVNSAVLIRLRPEALSTSASRVVAAHARQMGELASLQDSMNAAVEEALRQAEGAAGATRRGVDLSGKALEQFHAAYRKLLGTFRQVRSYVESAEPGTDAYERLVASSPGDIVAPVRAYLVREHLRLQRQFRDDVDSDSSSLSLTAWIGLPPRQLHLPGYDALPPGVAQPIDKTRFVFDERFEEEHAAAQKLAKSAGDWNALRKLAEEALRTQLGSLASAVEGVEKEARKVETVLSDAKLRSEAAAAKAIAEDLLHVATAVRATLDQAANPRGDTDPALLLRAVIGAFQAQYDEILDVTARIGKLASTVAEGAAGAKVSLGALQAGAAQLAAAAMRSGVASQPELTEVRVRLAQARDTELSLIQAERQEGDVVTIQARLRDGDTVVPGGETVRHLRVRARGWVADVGGAVLFVRPISHDPGALAASAGAYAVLRYKGSRAAGDSSANFFHVLAPGFGVSAVAVPRRQDGGTDLAWMATVHLLGDVLQASLGATTDLTPVWGVGIGLHRIAGIGKYFQ
jgi:hypothetical protein